MNKTPSLPGIDTSKAIDLSKPQPQAAFPLKLEWDRVDSIEAVKDFLKFLYERQTGYQTVMLVKAGFEDQFLQKSNVGKYFRKFMEEEIRDLEEKARKDEEVK
jgi:hypothetical protein